MAPENITHAGGNAASVGRVVEARYRLAARLGAGGMGTVYRATRLLIGDEVAVKGLHPARFCAVARRPRRRRLGCGGRWLITGEKDLQVYYVNR